MPCVGFASERAKTGHDLDDLDRSATVTGQVRPIYICVCVCVCLNIKIIGTELNGCSCFWTVTCS
jgi:hypothetical protein